MERLKPLNDFIFKKLFGEKDGEYVAHERANLISTGIEQGIEQGIERGKLEVATALLDVLDDETIALKTGLDIEKNNGPQT